MFHRSSLMARWPRLVLPGVPLHVVQRGNNRTDTFCSDEDFGRYRETLLAAVQRTGCLLHAYVLMTNHVHLLLTPPDPAGASQLMQVVGRSYVRYFNARYARSGTLWEGRFKSSLVDTTHYLLTCTRYIDLNPVRARMVETPGEYRWSSYRRLAAGLPDQLVTPHAVYAALGASPDARQRAYATLCASEVAPAAVQSLRVALRGGAVTGEAQFRAAVERATRRTVTRLPHGGDRRSSTFRSLANR